MSHYREPHPHTGALRAQLDSLIHRHSQAKFHVSLQIHQLASVPFLTGEFGVKWKFRGVVTPPKDKGKEKASRSFTTITTTKRTHSDETYPIIQKQFTTSPTQSTTSLPVTSQADTTNESITSSSETSISSESVSYSGETRGQTPWVKLQEHKVDYEHTVNVILQMHVENQPNSPTKTSIPTNSNSNIDLKLQKQSPGKLLPCPLKLVINQRVIPGDLDAPQNPRIGAVYLDLSEYADPKLGPVTRKYLLRESKTNAVLKLTIHVRTLSSPPGGFIAPPLQVASIQSSLSNLLSPHKHFRRVRTPSSNSAHKGSRSNTNAGLSLTMQSGRYPLSNSAAEDIIEAIFNPIPTTSPNSSPFTYYVSTSKPPSLTGGQSRKSSLREEITGDIDLDADADTSAENGGVPSITESAASIRSQTEESSGGIGGAVGRESLSSSSSTGSTAATPSTKAPSERSGLDCGKERGWWKRFNGHTSASRPVTPASVASRSSGRSATRDVS